MDAVLGIQTPKKHTHLVLPRDKEKRFDTAFQGNPEWRKKLFEQNDTHYHPMGSQTQRCRCGAVRFVHYAGQHVEVEPWIEPVN